MPSWNSPVDNLQDTELWDQMYNAIEQRENAVFGTTSFPPRTFATPGANLQDAAEWASLQARIELLLAVGWYIDENPFDDIADPAADTLTGNGSDVDGDQSHGDSFLPEPDYETVADVLGHEWTIRRPKKIMDLSDFDYDDGIGDTITASEGDIARNWVDGKLYRLETGVWSGPGEYYPEALDHRNAPTDPSHYRVKAGDYFAHAPDRLTHAEGAMWVFDEMRQCLNAMVNRNVEVVVDFTERGYVDESVDGAISEASAADALTALSDQWATSGTYADTDFGQVVKAWKEDGVSDYRIAQGSNGYSGIGFLRISDFEVNPPETTNPVVSYYIFTYRPFWAFAPDPTENVYDNQAIAPLTELTWKLWDTRDVDGGAAFPEKYKVATPGQVTTPPNLDSGDFIENTTGHTARTRGYVYGGGTHGVGPGNIQGMVRYDFTESAV